MPRAIRAGMIVTSHNTSQLNTSRFQGFSLLPRSWADSDIGAVGLPGSAAYTGGVFGIRGAGSDIWGTSDSFNYVHRSMSGDGLIVARVTGMQNTHPFAKVGLMIRAGLAANAAHVILDVRPGGETEFMRRASAGASTAFVAGRTASVPTWLRLVRTGSTITGSISSNGSTWTKVGSTTISLPAAVRVGVAVTSHEVSRLNTAVVDSVTVVP
jgi:regulation of enolase protein 1 (concanavalin A-like superfamily)